MKYYTVAELNITGRGWIREYVRHVTAQVERYGGRYLARTDKIEKTEGDRASPQFFLIIEWPSEEAAKAFYDSDEYRPYKSARQAGAYTESVLVAGEDVNGVARMGAEPRQ